eukprot:UN00057
MQSIDGKQMQNQVIRVSPSNPPYHRTSNTNLYVEGIPNGWNVDYIKEIFAKYGTVKEVNLLLNRTTHEKTGGCICTFLIHMKRQKQQ